MKPGRLNSNNLSLLSRLPSGDDCSPFLKLLRLDKSAKIAPAGKLPKGMRSGGRFSWEEGVEHDEDATTDDGGVCDIEVGPVVAPVAPAEEDFKEICYDAVAESVPYIADRSAEDEGEGNGGWGEAASDS